MEDQTQALTKAQGDGTTQAVAAPNQISAIEAVIAKGDLSKLTNEERVNYYRGVCESVGLNPFTQPFEYIELNGQLQLYPTKGAAEQLRKEHGISIDRLEETETGKVYKVRAFASDPSGRKDVATGAVILPRGGDALANAVMKAETKAKRRVTLSMLGLGMTDESEMHTIPSAQPVDVDHETGELQEPAQVQDNRTISTAQAKRLFAIAKNEGGYTEPGIRRLIGAYGYESTKDITRDDYDDIIEDAYLPGKAREYNTPDNQTDAFEQAEEDQQEDPGGEVGEEETTFQEDLDELEAKLEKAMGYETHTARKASVNDAMEQFSESHPNPTNEQRQAIMEVYDPVRAELSQAGQAQQQEAEEAEQDEHDPLNSKPALSQGEEQEEPLPEEFPWRGDLFEAGLTTAEDVLQAYSENGLDDVTNVGDKRAEEVFEAAQRLRDTGDWRPEAVKKQDDELPY